MESHCAHAYDSFYLFQLRQNRRINELLLRKKSLRHLMCAFKYTCAHGEKLILRYYQLATPVYNERKSISIKLFCVIAFLPSVIGLPYGINLLDTRYW